MSPEEIELHSVRELANWATDELERQSSLVYGLEALCIALAVLAAGALWAAVCYRAAWRSSMKP